MRSSLAAAGAVALIAGPTALAFFSGGYFDRPRIVAAIAAWALVLLAAVVSSRPLPVSTPGRLALAGLFGLCAWSAVSLLWAPDGGRAQADVQRLLLYLGFFIAAMALLRGRALRAWLEPLLVLGAFAVVAFGLSERLLPDLVELTRSRSAVGRLEQPLSYWNALGAVAAIGFVMAVRVAGDSGRDRLLRGLAAAAGVTLGLGVYLSFSRGALVAVAGGLLTLLALAPDGRAQLRSAVAVTVAAGLAALASTAFDDVQSLELGAQADAGEGIQMLAVLVALSLAAALLVPRRARRPIRAPSLGVSRPLAVLTVAIVTVAGAAVAVTLLEGKPQVVSPELGADPERLRSVDTNRYRYWDVAIETWADHPVAGIGSGGFHVRWLQQEDRVDASGDAHSLYLETLAELGVVGLALLVLFLGGIAVAVTRLLRENPAAAVGPAAALAVWTVHAGLDWDWEMPAVSLSALLLAAAVIAWSEEAGAETGSARSGQPAGIPAAIC